MKKYNENLCCRVYEKLLFAYPSDFRRSFGPQLVQVFRDCYRAETNEHGALRIIPLCLHTLMDLISSAANEHSESENKFMSNLKRDLIAAMYPAQLSGMQQALCFGLACIGRGPSQCRMRLSVKRAANRTPGNSSSFVLF